MIGNVLNLFYRSHHIVESGMGGLSINLMHLPHPGDIQQQSEKLLAAFDVIRETIKEKHLAAIKAKVK